MSDKRKLQQLKVHGCSKKQIEALMKPEAPTLWVEDKHGQLYPLDGTNYKRSHWFNKMLKNATWETIGK